MNWVLILAIFFALQQELRELQESLKETSVVVQMDNSRGLDMDQIMSDVKAQYEDIAARNCAEAENWYKNKVKSYKRIICCNSTSNFMLSNIYYNVYYIFKSFLLIGGFYKGWNRQANTNKLLQYPVRLVLSTSLVRHLIITCSACNSFPLFVLCRHKFDQMAAQAGQADNELRTTRGEIAELNRMISRLQMEIQAAQGQVSDGPVESSLNTSHYSSKMFHHFRYHFLIMRCVHAFKIISWYSGIRSTAVTPNESVRSFNSLGCNNKLTNSCTIPSLHLYPFLSYSIPSFRVPASRDR